MIRSLLPLASWLSAALLSGAADARTTWRRPADVAGFVAYRGELRRLVDHYATRRVNRFCAVVRDVREPPSATSEGDSQTLLIHWREGATIYTYGPSAGGPIGLENQDAGATIDLKEDVVASAYEVDGSTSRVTRAIVGDILRHCGTSGTRATILRRGFRK